MNLELLQQVRNRFEECGFHPDVLLSDPTIQEKFIQKGRVIVFHKGKKFWTISFMKEWPE